MSNNRVKKMIVGGTIMEFETKCLHAGYQPENGESRPMLMIRQMRLENYLIWKRRGIFIHDWQIQRLVQ